MHPLRSFVCLLFRFVPRPWRFRAAVRFSRLVRPLIARTPAWPARRELRTDRLEETSLDLILTVLTRYGVEYDPIIEIDGIEYMPRPGDEHPCLLACAHMMLNSLIARHLYDTNVPFGAMTAEKGMRYPGTRVPVDAITPTDARLLEARRHLARQSGVVSAMIDRDVPERRTLEFETVNGKLIVSTALLQLALRMNARIIFFGTRMRDDNTIVMTVRPAEETSVEGLAAEFARFIDQVLTATTPRTSRPPHSSDRTTAIRG